MKKDDEVIDIGEQDNCNTIELPPFWSVDGIRARWADPSFRRMLWNIFLLSWSWSLGEGAFFIQISTTTIAATNFANWYLATIPIGCMLLISTIWSVFLPRTIARFGYRPPLYFGALMGMTGAGLCIVATWFKWYWLLVIGAAFLGGQVPCTLYYRLIALQFSTQEFASKAIAMVVAGGCLSSLIGPEIAKHTVNALPRMYSGAYLTTLCECTLLLFTMTIIQFPEQKKNDYKLVLTSTDDNVKMIDKKNKNQNIRSIFVIARQRTFLIASLGGFVSWSAMAIQMSATPLTMTKIGYTFSHATTAIEYHLLGMFVPSFFTGTLCNWFGNRLVMLIGFLTQLTGTLLFQRGFELHHFYVSLIIIGIGWNFGYVGASSLLTQSHSAEEETRTHSLYEALVMFGISISFFSSAFLEHFIGWMNLTGKLMSIYLGVASFILAIDTIFVFCTKYISNQRNK
ncbi:unnamed protein product [Adineta steineri]|uniref:Major facilitator superfamily (MFS) profile domain-containing protein n=1 Tax=Adineta steineri TaxID=433720 RepID=A0A819XX14_9BILA|nr:unnamed protein product [Adineta steineri]CAF4147562.1 unnamed protein product [Adineta steineri]